MDLTHRELGVGRAEPDVGTQRDLEAAAQRVPVDGGDHRDLQLLPHPGDLLAEVGDAALRHVGRRGCPGTAIPAAITAAITAGHLLEGPEVEPRAEGRAFAGQHHDPDARLLLQPLAHLGEADEHGAVEGVALVGPVHADVGDAPFEVAGDALGGGLRHVASLAARQSTSRSPVGAMLGSACVRSTTNSVR